MHRSASKKVTVYNRLSFITLPIVFTLLSFLLVYIAFQPIIEPAVAAAQMLIGAHNQVAVGNVNLMDIDGVAPSFAAGQKIPLSSVTKPIKGDQYGRLTVQGTAIDAPVYWGDAHEELNKGIGTYSGAWLPGFGRTVMLAGHTGTWFSDMESVELGTTIQVETHYGTYTYEVVKMDVKKSDDPSAYDFAREDENIILYTCYPFRYVGFTDERYFVYGKLLQGNEVDTQA